MILSALLFIAFVDECVVVVVVVGVHGCCYCCCRCLVCHVVVVVVGCGYDFVAVGVVVDVVVFVLFDYFRYSC